ncbi:hypothetical protein MLD38_038875 [Melastoma candidum]|nr:hypothetical protein MLD38_038875 [Melastoma candidum]
MCADTESNDNEGRHKCSSEQAVRRSSRQKHSVSYKEARSDEDDTLNPPKRSKGSVESLHAQNGAQEEAKLKRDDHASKVPGVLKSAQPEFSDFGKDRREECFAVGQVWAVYNSNDNIPRSYALIGRVSRAGPKVKITWLTPYADDVDEINWITAGLPVAVGNFNLGKDDLIDDFRMFSHKVVWEKGHGKGPHKVYPKLGETWALFKNWDIKWSFDADRKYEYEVVEILCDYNEENGIEVAYLGKLKGFVSLFSREVGQGRNKFRISSSELYRFSHRIPSIKLTGSEGESVPTGSFELDPASVPTNLDETILPEVMMLESGTNGCSDECNSDSSEESSIPLSEASNDSRVPEPVFFNFDDAKSPGNFKVGQIWSLYSDEDSLPKYYGLITQVTTDPAFKIHLSWLASHSLPKGAIKWRDRKMLISCGRFKIDNVDPVCYDSTDAFCHRINTSASQEKDGTWNILPSKGEVWALYKNWNSGLQSSSLGDCEYDLVEVIGAAESVITVGMLERASRFSCIQRPQTRGSSRVTLQIPLVEILRFSHQVPAFQITEQKKGILRGFWEFDPLAVPARYFSSKSN